jgi:ribosomal protein S18 acetylase RimI-like enzyme
MTTVPFGSVRRVAPEEGSVLRRLRLRALATDPTAFGSTLEREQGFPEELWNQRALSGSEAPDQATFLALDGTGRPVGLVTVMLKDGRRDIFAMWVDPSARGHGLGGQLLDACLAWGPADTPVHLDVNPGQAAAVALYRSRGFDFNGESRELRPASAEKAVGMVRPPQA